MASRVRVRLTATVRALALALAVILVTTMTAGWLYWLRSDVARWPGPLVRDVLPLDELPGHDRIPLLVCLVVFPSARWSGWVLALSPPWHTRSSSRSARCCWSRRAG